MVSPFWILTCFRGLILFGGLIESPVDFRSHQRRLTIFAVVRICSLAQFIETSDDCRSYTQFQSENFSTPFLIFIKRLLYKSDGLAVRRWFIRYSCRVLIDAPFVTGSTPLRFLVFNFAWIFGSAVSSGVFLPVHWYHLFVSIRYHNYINFSRCNIVQSEQLPLVQNTEIYL